MSRTAGSAARGAARRASSDTPAGRACRRSPRSRSSAAYQSSAELQPARSPRPSRRAGRRARRAGPARCARRSPPARRRAASSQVSGIDTVGPRTAAHRPGRGDGAVPGGLVEVQEHALAALLLPPRDGRPLRAAARPPGARSAITACRTSTKSHSGRIRAKHVDAAPAGGLRPADQAGLVEHLAQHRRPPRRRRRSRCPAAGRGRCAARPGRSGSARRTGHGWKSKVPMLAAQTDHGRLGRAQRLRGARRWGR